MKKTKLLTSLVAFALVLGLGACDNSECDTTTGEEECEGDECLEGNEPEHEHTLGDWIVTEEGHYQECLECGEALNFALHEYPETYSLDQDDARYHSRACTVCAYIEREAHQASQEGVCLACGETGLNVEGLEYEAVYRSNEELDEDELDELNDIESDEEVIGYYVSAYDMTLNARDLYIPTTYEGLPVLAVGAYNASSENDSIFAGDKNGDTNNYLEFVALSNNVIDLNPYSFYNAYSIRTVELSVNLETIGADVFRACYALASISKIPSGVTVIGDEAFYQNYSLASISFSDTLVEIGSKVFYYDYSLKDVQLPSSLEKIGEYAFSECYSLTEINIPGSLTTIESKAFYNCYSLEKVDLEEGLTLLGVSMFEACHALREITLPSTLETIGSSAFNYCYSLAEIEIPDSVTELGTGAFQSCESLTSIVIPGSIKDVANNAFNGCFSLESVVLQEGVERIGQEAFGKCYSLTYISIPSTVTEIDSKAFYYCYSLTYINLPDSVQTLGTYVFDYCYSLRIVTIPDGVETIDNYAFRYNYSLVAVVIPASVTSIGDNAFRYCYALRSVLYKGTVAEWETLLPNISSTYNTFLTNADVYYYDETGLLHGLDSEHTYWHYVDGEITLY